MDVNGACTSATKAAVPHATTCYPTHVLASVAWAGRSATVGE
jgi:hypothetical protein